SQVHTLSCEIVGTLQYMAPEQMVPQGQGSRPLTVAADVWSVGAILYELLAGHPPYMENNPNVIELLQRKGSGLAPVPPSVLLGGRAHFDRDLEWICLRCLQREPSERFSAEELAAALRRYLNREVVGPRETPWEKLRRWMRRVDDRAADYQDPDYQ